MSTTSSFESPFEGHQVLAHFQCPFQPFNINNTSSSSFITNNSHARCTFHEHPVSQGGRRQCPFGHDGGNDFDANNDLKTHSTSTRREIPPYLCFNYLVGGPGQCRNALLGGGGANDQNSSFQNQNNQVLRCQDGFHPSLEELVDLDHLHQKMAQLILLRDRNEHSNKDSLSCAAINSSSSDNYNKSKNIETTSDIVNNHQTPKDGDDIDDQVDFCSTDLTRNFLQRNDSTTTTTTNSVTTTFAQDLVPSSSSSPNDFIEHQNQNSSTSSSSSSSASLVTKENENIIENIEQNIQNSENIENTTTNSENNSSFIHLKTMPSPTTTTTTTSSSFLNGFNNDFNDFNDIKTTLTNNNNNNTNQSTIININTNHKVHQCVVCLDHFSEHTTNFGLLEQCTHVFCAECILTWQTRPRPDGRKGPNRKCPMCRTRSNRTVIAQRLPTSEDEKRLLFEQQFQCFRLAGGKFGHSSSRGFKGFGSSSRRNGGGSETESTTTTTELGAGDVGGLLDLDPYDLGIFTTYATLGGRSRLANLRNGNGETNSNSLNITLNSNASSNQAISVSASDETLTSETLTTNVSNVNESSISMLESRHGGGGNLNAQSNQVPVEIANSSDADVDDAHRSERLLTHEFFQVLGRFLDQTGRRFDRQARRGGGGGDFQDNNQNHQPLNEEDIRIFAQYGANSTSSSSSNSSLNSSESEDSDSEEEDTEEDFDDDSDLEASNNLEQSAAQLRNNNRNDESNRNISQQQREDTVDGTANLNAAANVNANVSSSTANSNANRSNSHRHHRQIDLVSFPPHHRSHSSLNRNRAAATAAIRISDDLYFRSMFLDSSDEDDLDGDLFAANQHFSEDEGEGNNRNGRSNENDQNANEMANGTGTGTESHVNELMAEFGPGLMRHRFQ